jgi:hypothetical protein
MQFLLAPHLLDAMHIEKNICAALVKTFSNCKGTKADGLPVREAMKELNWVGMQRFWPEEDGTYADLAWVWSTEEWDRIIHIISNIQTPTGYGASFCYKFNNRKLVGFKTHDYHNLLHDILPIVVRGTLTPAIRDIVYRIGQEYLPCWNFCFSIDE